MITPKTNKVLNVFDVIIMTMTANFGIRWIAVAAGIGPSSIFLWLFGALIFFLPLSIITAQLSRAYPDAGGMYAWVRNALGDKHGFTVAWLYWVTNIFYYPAILIFLASNLAFAIGRPELATDPKYIMTTALIGFWLIVAISSFGLKASKYFVGIGGILGLFFPMLLLIIFGVIAYFKWGSATDFSPSQFIPGGGVTSNLPSLTMIMFAMAGVEVIATFSNRVKNPRRDLYLGLLGGSAGIFVLYVVGTLMMNVFATPETLSKTSGIIQAFQIVDVKFHVAWLSRLIASALAVAELAAIIVWLLAPIIMFFECTPRGVLPNWMHKSNADGTPINAILFQGVLVSIVIMVTSLLPNINAMYQVLVLMSTILFFIPYFYLAIAYIFSLHHLKMNKTLGVFMASGVLISIALGIIVSFVPSSDLKTMHDIVFYESELVLGPVLFIGLGWLLYRFRKITTNK
ncbi:MAG: APC family permease [Pseudomonadota bacterium]